MMDDDRTPGGNFECLPGFNLEAFQEVPAGFFAHLTPEERIAKQQLYTLAWARAQETVRQRRDEQWMIKMGFMGGDGI